MTPALTVIGILLVILAIPLAFSLAPLVIGAVLVVFGYRRANDALAAGPDPALA